MYCNTQQFQLLWLLLFNEGLEGATSCDSITVSHTNRRSQREGLYKLQLSGNDSSCNGRPVWKSQLIDSWISYSAADAAWYIADASCGNTGLSDGMNVLALVVLLPPRRRMSLVVFAVVFACL